MVDHMMALLHVRTSGRGKGGWLSAAAAVTAAVLALPVLIVLASILAPASATWAHLTATVLPEYIANTLWLVLGTGIGVTVIGFIRNGVGFLKLFVPSGVPIFLLPLLVLIEFISYLTRPISLSVRLFANMMAGHTMLKVFGGFVVSLGIIGGWAPLAFVVALTGLEILIAFLQAYVFAILTCIYLNDAFHVHH